MTPVQSTSSSNSNRSNGVLGSKTSISIGLLFVLILPLISVATFIAITREKLSTMGNEIKALQLEICQHKALGIDGIDHPQGSKIKIESLEKELKQRTRDRWTKADDEMFMEKFAHENKLSLPKHEPITPPN